MSKYTLNEITGDYFFNENVSKKEILDLAFTIAKEAFNNKKMFLHAYTSSDYLRAYLMEEEKELFGAVFLTTQHALIATEILFTGTINTAPVYPREILKRALELNAAAIIVFHNHPSGDPEPSQADIQITEKIKQALKIVDVSLLDHFIVGKAGATSLAQRGYI